MACELVLIPPDHVARIWDKAGALIASAMHKTQLSDLEILKRQLHSGQALLWVAVDAPTFTVKATAATQVAIVNGHKYCTIIACGGNGRADWLPLIHGLEDYARAQHCEAMRIFGRKGWSRVLPDYNIVGHITERKLA